MLRLPYPTAALLALGAETLLIVIEVVAAYPGASAEEMERQVTGPLEVTPAGMPTP